MTSWNNFTHTCPRCAGYVGIVFREPGRNTSLQTVNGHCLKCDYRFAWIVVIRGEQHSAVPRKR